MKTTSTILALCWITWCSNLNASHPSADDILRATGVHGGVVVQLGCGDGQLAAAFGANEHLVVHALDANAGNVAAARRYIRGQGLYGRVSVQQWTERRLPYTDNLISLVVAEDLGRVPMAEVMRVLAPGAGAYIKQDGKWRKNVKPWPEDIDQWTHFLHGSDGNAVAHDTVVGPPRHYQWVSGPLWLRSHESDSSVRALVTDAGRLFYIADDGPISLLGENPLPDKWFLTARDAFNGVLLWKVPIRDWGWRAWKPSWFTPRPGNIPLNIQKRLVAAEGHVYVTLGYRAPVSQLDAATGAVLRTYDQTARTEEILYCSGTLILTVLRDDRVAVMAVDARQGQTRWTSANTYRGTTTDYYRFRAMHGSVPAAKIDPTLNVASDGKLIAILDGQDVVCLDFDTGKEKWRQAFPLVEADYRAGNIKAGRTLWAGTLIVRDGVIIHASPNQLAGFSAASGKLLWKQPKKYLQHLWYEWKDVFVIDGLVWTWSAELDREKLAGTNQRSSWPDHANGYDLHTGQIKQQVPLGHIFKTHHHHRCYRDKATTRYILASRRGSEFVDLRQGKHSINNWVRGTCHLGMMPANGLLYAPPHPCVCYINEKLNGFQALAPARQTVDVGRNSSVSEGDSDPPRLVRGPAYGKVEPRRESTGRDPSEDWPTFRHDPLRSGGATTRIASRPRRLWRRNVGKKLAPPVVADGRVFVPLVDEQQLVSLDAMTGESQWTVFADGRIDSPPTCYQATVVYGSADGRVYCRRAADGELVWRFQAAPAVRRIGAFGQLESAWPVHGSVLVMDGTAYFAAGRTSELDGGIYLYGLDATSGQIRYQRNLDGPHYDAGNIEQNFQLPMGALPDILQGNDGLIFMREQTLNTKLEPQVVRPRRTQWHVYAKGGFLDDTYFKRAPWSFGPQSAYARLIAHDDRAVFFVRMFDTLRGLDPKVYFTPGKQGYLLFARDKQTGEQRWSRRIRVRITAMVATEQLLFVAGPPDVVDPQDPLGAFEGRKGGVLCAIDRDTGKTVWRQPLATPPVFNGMAAAAGRLLVAMQDGSIACYGE